MNPRQQLPEVRLRGLAPDASPRAMDFSGGRSPLNLGWEEPVARRGTKAGSPRRRTLGLCCRGFNRRAAGALPQPVLGGDVGEQSGAAALHDVVHLFEAAGTAVVGVGHVE